MGCGGCTARGTAPIGWRSRSNMAIRGRLRARRTRCSPDTVRPPISLAIYQEVNVSRVVVIEYVSLDGVVQGPGHADEDRDGGFKHGGWTGPFMAEHGRYLSESFQAAGGFLLGA
jgi:hypothetical protein